MSLELVKSLVSNYAHIQADVKLVKVLCKKAEFSKPKECYKNAFLALSSRVGDPSDMYVLGFVMIGEVPIEHAWIKVGGRYIDVTLTESDFEYISVLEMPLQVVYEISEVEYPNLVAPDLFDVNKFLRKNKNKGQ